VVLEAVVVVLEAVVQEAVVLVVVLRVVVLRVVVEAECRHCRVEASDQRTYKLLRQ
jgi:hypothetical protein